MTSVQNVLTASIVFLGLTLAGTVLAESLSIEKRTAEKQAAVLTKAPLRTEVPYDQTPLQTSQLEQVLKRKARLQQMLVALDRLAAITQQMKPETADRIEPVILDLADQAIELSSERELRRESADDSIEKLEVTVGALVRALNRSVEPELSL